MTESMRCCIRGGLLGVLALLASALLASTPLAGPLAAQEQGAPPVVPVDTVPADSAVVVPSVVAPVMAEPAIVGFVVPVDRRGRVAVASDTLAADSAGRPELPPDPAADSVLQLLMGVPGYSATQYQGERAVYRAEDEVLRLQGTPQVVRDGSVLTAVDSIVYRSGTELVEAYGDPTVQGQSQELTGDVLFYDLARSRATALGARTQVTQGATWYVTGDVSLEGSDRVYATHGAFTTCDLEIPHYHFESDQIMVVRDQLLVARPARLYFGRVPVMVLPFVVQNLERGRRSGLLVPRFGINDIVRTSSGYTRQISDLGWYWAINDYLGAQISGTWRSGAYTALTSNVDFRWRRQFLNGSATYQQYWRDDGSEELSFNTSAQWQPDERTNLSMAGRYASSSQFLRDVSYDPREVTQDLASTLSVSRRFDWGTMNLGAERRQSVADGGVSMTLPSFAISPKTVTLFRSATPEQASWFSDAALTANLSGRRSLTQGMANLRTGRQDQDELQLQGSSQISVGNLTGSFSGSLNETLLQAVVGADSLPDLSLPESRDDRASVQASLGYQQQLIGQTSLTPNISLDREFRRDTTQLDPDGMGSPEELSYVGGPTRVRFGASLSSALFGFYPGVGPYTSIRHRVSPTLSYSYAPATQLTPLQERVFGPSGGRTQNLLSVGINQTWEAKLRPREVEEVEQELRTDTLAADTLAADTLAADTTAAAQGDPVPAEPEKVTILSINTSAIQYDFADTTGVGWVTERVSNTISSDYLKGLTIRMEHELFDRRGLDPSIPGNRGRLGSFAPRLSRLSTGFELGPGSAVFQWLGMDDDETSPATQGAIPGMPEEEADPSTGTFTGNPQTAGSGPWRANFNYSYTRGARTYRTEAQREFYRDEPVQTLTANLSFSLTPNWEVNWNTDYSITDGRFGTHRLNFTRDLHRWQANFSFYQTPNGNSAFEFFVELIDNREIKLDYRERNLGIDRR